MIKLIRRMLGLCVHDFSKWEVAKKMVASQDGYVKIFQTRTCTKCGYTQITSECV